MRTSRLLPVARHHDRNHDTPRECTFQTIYKTVHQQPAPDQEEDLWELQAAEFNLYRLSDPESERNITCLLLLLLECGQQAAGILGLSGQWNQELCGVAVTLVEFWQSSFTKLSACVPHA